ncbi:F0F1 ATP synthase subunit A [Clostridium vincentii]|uniref:ATP synthase subunit a n=1 Tax=Clostridium vincentii TaxID=52704 RepID=A0A2T0BH66_9CLOT|nr:F0F1 ATP synthase subunit A [Clostridium vincentii]PRR83152.1 ATP synthase subunit a [Clostridium vincentii]
MEPVIPIFSFEIGSFSLIIGKEIIWQWVVILILGISAFLLTRNLKKNPNKKQVVLETLYTTVENLVKSNMGEKFINYVPYIGTIIIYLLVMNLLGVLGIKPPTQNLSVTLALGVSTFFVINGTAVKKNGALKYMKGLAQPYAFMLPINILERVMLPFSLALRLFGNMLAATILVEMLYEFLESITWIAGIGLPIVGHIYFDMFDGGIQMLVFVMLTMINIKITAEHH